MATTSDGTPTDPQAPPDRPIQNVVGEFNRKFGQIEQKLNQLTGYLADKEAAAAQPPPAAAPKGSFQSMSDDELWDLAKAGNKEAFDAHQDRRSARTYAAMRGQESHQQLVDGQLQILQGKYPVLSNAQHPLTQTANAAYNLLTRRGYQPSQATYLEAVKTAIADRPDLVAEMHTQGARAREGARRVSAGNSGVTGTTVRQTDPQQDGKIRVSPEQAAIARRMNVKDPVRAITNFVKRQETGESQFGAVATSIQQENF